MFCITLIAGCTSQIPKPLTDAEKEALKNEVKRDFNAMIEACNKVNVETALKLFWDSPDFIGIGVDGVIIDFSQFRKANEDMFNNAKSMQFTTIKDDVRILKNDQVLYIYQYNAEIIMNTGEKINYDKLTMTSLIEKIEGFWKIVFYHESGMPPVVTQPEKK